MKRGRPMGWSATGAGRWRRSAAPARLAAVTAARWATTYLAWGERKRRRRERFVLRTADDVTRTMGDMKGAAMKVGQVLSLMTGVVPGEMAGRLATLQADAPPMSFDLVEDVFRREFGSRPGAIFRRFEQEPFAAASIGQVHRAVLADGTKVAVKVQYPGVAEAIGHDLANIGVLLGVGGMLAPGVDTGVLLRDLREGIEGELDYLREAQWQQRFSDLFEGHGLVQVPRVHHELTRRTVLVQEYLDGERFSEAHRRSHAERQRIAEIVFRFAFGNFYRHCLFNGDPHPGNYLLLRDGRIGFVDYGCVATFSQDVIERFKALVRTLYEGDIEAWRAAAEDIGILRPGAPFSTSELYEHMHWFWAPILEERVAMTEALVGEMVRRNVMTTGDGGRINRHLNIPEGMAFLTRINFGLAGVMASLGAEGPWRGIIGEYVYDAPPSTPLGELSRRTTRNGMPI